MSIVRFGVFAACWQSSLLLERCLAVEEVPRNLEEKVVDDDGRPAGQSSASGGKRDTKALDEADANLMDEAMDEADAELMDEADAKLRMKACFTITLKTVPRMKEHLTKLAKEFINVKGLTESQAFNTVIVARVMNCYMTILPAEQKTIESGLEPSLESLNEIYGDKREVPQKPEDASKRQWELLDSVMKEAMKDTPQKQQKSSQATGQKENNRPKANASTTRQALPDRVLAGRMPLQWSEMAYGLAPLGVIFGLLGFLVRKLRRQGSGDSSNRKRTGSGDSSNEKGSGDSSNRSCGRTAKAMAKRKQ